MGWPNVSVIIPTYNRPNVLVQTVKLLSVNLIYDGTVSYYIGDDGDGAENDAWTALYDVFHHDPFVYGNLCVLDGPRRRGKQAGLGGNLNMLLMETPDTLMLQMDDDHHLRERLYLSPHVKLLMEKAKAGWVRLMGVANHSYQASLEGAYWYINWHSTGDYSLYIPSNRPHLKHRRFHDIYGYYPEAVSLGQTEEGFCHQCRNVVKRWEKSGRDIAEMPHVVVPLNPAPHTERGWAHVGQTWQHTEDDIEEK